MNPRLPTLLLLLSTAAGFAQQNAEYEVVFEATWSQQTHPIDFPFDPHFSGLIGATHHAEHVFWQEGSLATPGVQQVAETGLRSLLQQEVQLAIDLDLADQALLGLGIGQSPGSTSLTFGADRDFPALTLISMIAPSPDWFVGVNGLVLHDGTRWIDELEVPLFAYDAGTDSGVTFTAPNLATMPPVPIFAIDSPPLEGTVPLGRFLVRRTDAPTPTLNLRDSRFQVSLTFRTPDGTEGFGRPAHLTDDSGTFWFFHPDNIELVVKVLDACAAFERYWVFAGGLTDLETRLSVKDTATGEVRIYSNPLGEPFQPLQDTDAFATCP